MIHKTNTNKDNQLISLDNGDIKQHSFDSGGGDNNLDNNSNSDHDDNNAERIFIVELGTSIKLRCDDGTSLSTLSAMDQHPQQQLQDNYNQVLLERSRLDYVWFFNDKIMTPQSVIMSDNNEYEIVQFSHDNIGTYKCYISPSLDGSTVPVVEQQQHFDESMVSPEVSLQLKVMPKLTTPLPFVTTIKFGYQQTSADHTQVFRCRAQCQPICRIAWSMNDETIDLDSTTEQQYSTSGSLDRISVNGGQYGYQTFKRTIQKHDYNIKTIDRYIRNSKTRSWSYWSRNIIKRHNQAFSQNDLSNTVGLDNNKSSSSSFIVTGTDSTFNSYSVSELVIQDKLIMDLLIGDTMTIKCFIVGQEINQQSKTRIFVERSPWSIRLSQGNAIKLSDISRLLQFQDDQPQVIASTIECQAKGYPEPRYEWKYVDSNMMEHDIVSDGQTLNIVNLIKMKLDLEKSKQSSLSTIDLISSVMGNYTCSAINIHGEVRESFNLQLKGAPICQLTKSNEQVNSGNDHSIVDLKCDIYSYWRPIEVLWYKGNELVSKHTNQTNMQPNELIHNDNTLRQTVILPLILHNAMATSFNDLNAYRCVIRDNLGQIASCQINHYDSVYIQNYKKYSLADTTAIHTDDIISEKIPKYPHQLMNSTRFSFIDANNNSSDISQSSYGDLGQNFLLVKGFSIIIVIVLLGIIYLTVHNLRESKRACESSAISPDGISPRSSLSSAKSYGCLTFKSKRDSDRDTNSRNDYSNSILLPCQPLQQQLKHDQGTIAYNHHQLQLSRDGKNLSSNSTMKPYSAYTSSRRKNSSLESMVNSINDGTVNMNSKTLMMLGQGNQSGESYHQLYNNDYNGNKVPHSFVVDSEQWLLRQIMQQKQQQQQQNSVDTLFQQKSYLQSLNRLPSHSSSKHKTTSALDKVSFMTGTRKSYAQTINQHINQQQDSVNESDEPIYSDVIYQDTYTKSGGIFRNQIEFNRQSSSIYDNELQSSDNSSYNNNQKKALIQSDQFDKITRIDSSTLAAPNDFVDRIVSVDSDKSNNNCYPYLHSAEHEAINISNNADMSKILSSSMIPNDYNYESSPMSSMDNSSSSHVRVAKKSPSMTSFKLDYGGSQINTANRESKGKSLHLGSYNPMSSKSPKQQPFSDQHHELVKNKKHKAIDELITRV